MATNCDPSALLQASACMNCIPPGDVGPVMIYLLQQIAGTSYTADQLVQRATCYRCIPDGMQMPVMNMLLCTIVNS